MVVGSKTLPGLVTVVVGVIVTVEVSVYVVPTAINIREPQVTENDQRYFSLLPTSVVVLENTTVGV